MKQGTRQGSIILMLPTLVWVFSQIVMSGMGLGAVNMGARLQEISAISTGAGAEDIDLDPQRIQDQRAPHKVPPVKNQCDWCAHNAGIAPVHAIGLTITPPIARTVALLTCRQGANLTARTLCLHFHSRAPPLFSAA